MGQQQSKDELLHQQVNDGNIEGIKALLREGASLECFDKEGKTPLTLACSKPELINVAITLIGLGANVNAYRPGCNVGTPLHHAAKRGLHQTVKLLLSHGANALVTNIEGRTPLDIARAKGYSFVVRAIESHICFFSGWLRELHGPSFLEALAPQWLSRKIWVVVIPHSSRKPRTPLKLEVAIYPSQQDARPLATIALSKAKIQEPKFHQPDPALIIFDKATKKRYKLASANEGDKTQLQWFCNACRGAPQAMHPSMQPHTHTPAMPPHAYIPVAPVMPPHAHSPAMPPHAYIPEAPVMPPHAHSPVVPAVAPPSVEEDVALAMAISASLHSTMEKKPSLLHDSTYPSYVVNTNVGTISADNPHHNGWGRTEGPVPPSKASSSGWLDVPAEDAYKGWGESESGPSSNPSQHNIPAVAPTTIVPTDNLSHNVWGSMEGPAPPSKASSSGWLDEPAKDAYNGLVVPEAKSSSNLSLNNSAAAVPITHEIPRTASIPSAPPIAVGADGGPIQYPQIDSSSVDLPIPKLEERLTGTSEVKADGSATSSCVICLDAPVEGACIPCGHMAGCMSCLNEIKAKKWGCPVCRAKMDQVIRLYSV